VAVAVLTAAALLVFAPQVVELLYRHGRFTGQDAEHVSSILRVLTLAIPAFVAQQVGVRAFFARGDTWRPMLLGTGLALAVIPLYALLAQRSGTVGLAAAGVLAITANGLATLVWARLRHGAPSLLELASTSLRASAVAVAAGIVGAWVVGGRDGSVGALVDLMLGGAVFSVVAGVGIALIGDAAMRDPIRSVAGRLRASIRSGPAPDE
jgi:putative peptidoglycan lipid II flippase